MSDDKVDEYEGLCGGSRVTSFGFREIVRAFVGSEVRYERRMGLIFMKGSRWVF